MIKTAKQRMADAEEFLRELGRGIPDDERVMAGYAEEATVQTDATGKKVNAGFWPVPYKEGKYIDANKNCYVCISSSIKTPNPRTGEERYWRGESSFGHGLALMVDDIGTGTGSKGGLTIEALSEVLQPTAVVETSPNNYQAFYFLDTPEASLVKFKAFLVCFVTNVLHKGGDSTIRDISRYGRMPVGVNNKRHGSGGDHKYLVDGKPFNVQLHKADYSRRYSIERIAKAFNFVVLEPVKRNIEFDESEADVDNYWLRSAIRLMNGQGEGSGGMVQENMSGKFRIQCPWGNEHTNGDTFGAYFRGPIPGGDVDFVFGCGHDTCRKDNKRTWSHFVDLMVMPEIIDELERANNGPMAKMVGKNIRPMGAFYRPSRMPNYAAMIADIRAGGKTKE